MTISLQTTTQPATHRAVLPVVMLALATVVSAVASLNVAIPSIALSTHASHAQLSWIIDAYALVFAALLLPGGALGDRYGRRRALLAGLVIFGGGSLAAMFASGPGWLIAIRGVLGLGAALVMPATLSTITSTFPPASKPRAVEGGLVARSARGAIGEHWWSRRFLEVLESFALGSRLTRGKNYARRGQVISLEVAPGVVTARVQGSRRTPYKVSISLPAFSELVWAKVEVTLAEQAIHSARLLAGEMPHDLEEVLLAGWRTAISAEGSGPDPELFLPGLGGPVQAPRGHVLPPRGELRRRPLRHPAVARAQPRGTPETASRAEGRRYGTTCGGGGGYGRRSAGGRDDGAG